MARFNGELADVMRAGVLLSQTWPASRDREGETLRAAEIAFDDPFFEAFQMVDVLFPAERRRIGTLVRKKAIALTYCLARALKEEDIDLSAGDERTRRAAVRRTLPYLDDAREAGACIVQVMSGTAPATEFERTASLRRLADSLTELCEAGRREPAVTITIEPLDVRVHKRGALGTTEEAHTLARALTVSHGNFGLCIDTAHLLLNGEDPSESLRILHECITELHFCNCVTEQAHPLFGDRHIPFGPPGVVDERAVAKIMVTGAGLGFFSTERRPRVFCEVLAKEGEAGGMMSYCRRILEQGWQLARESIERSE